LANANQPRLRETPLNFIGGSPVGNIPFKPWYNNQDKFEERIK